MEQCFNDLEHKAVWLWAILEVACRATLNFLPTPFLSTVSLRHSPCETGSHPPAQAHHQEGAKTLTASCPVESYQSSIAEAASWSFLDVGGKGAR